MKILLFLFGFTFFGIGMYLLSRPKKLKKRCTQITEGTVIGYNPKDANENPVSDGMDHADTGVRRPVTQYFVQGNAYTTIGPSYMCYTDIHLQTYPEEKGTVEFQNGVIHSHAVRDKWHVHSFNPYEELFPLGTRVTVYYDPEDPGFSYADHIPDDKLIGRIFSLVGMGVIAVAIIALLL